MKTKIITLITLAFISLSNLHAQVGIGTQTPKTTLQIQGEPTSTTKADGMQAPTLSLAQLDAKVAAYGTDQDGALVYVDDVTGGSTEPETAAITATGYYYYDAPNDTWKKIGGRSTNYYLGQEAFGGIIYYLYIGGDGEQHGLVVSKTETSAAWQSVTSLTGANRSWDGAYNTNLMTNSPAKNWINNNFSSDWYLPSIDELVVLFNRRHHVNKSLNSSNSTLITNRDYWSSNEINASKSQKFVYLENSNNNISSKTSILKIRAIRDF